MKRSMKRGIFERATRCSITSVSRGRLQHGAVAHELAPQRQAVGEIAVVGDGEAAAVELGEQRLHVAQDGLAGGRVARMADGGGAGQAFDHLAAW